MKKKRRIIMLAAVFLVSAFCFLPVRLQVTLRPGHTYQYETITKSDLSVRAQALSGIAYPIRRFSMSRTTDGVSKNLKVSSGPLTRTKKIAEEPVSFVEAVYRGRAENGAKFRASLVRVTVTYRNGEKRKTNRYTIKNQPETIRLLDTIIIHTEDYGDLPLQYESAVSVTGLSAKPSEKLYEGTAITEEMPDVTALLSDGKAESLSDWTLDLPDGSAYAGDGQDVYIHTRYGAVLFDESDVIPITGIYTDALRTEGDKAPTEGLRLVFADGKSTAADESAVKTEGTPVLSAGMNRLSVTYHGRPHTLYVSASEKTAADLAAEEDAGGDTPVALVETHRLYASCTEQTSGDGVYFMTHLVPADPSCLSVGTPGSTDSAVLIGCGKPEDVAVTDGHTISFLSSGQLAFPGAGYTKDELAASGVSLFIGTDAPVLILDGEETEEGNTDAGGTITGGAVGMTKPGDYYVLTSNDALSWRDMQDILFSLGCTEARGLTGSAYLSIDGQTISGSVPSCALAFSGKETG